MSCTANSHLLNQYIHSSLLNHTNDYSLINFQQLTYCSHSCRITCPVKLLLSINEAFHCILLAIFTQSLSPLSSPFPLSFCNLKQLKQFPRHMSSSFKSVASTSPHALYMWTHGLQTKLKNQPTLVLVLNNTNNSHRYHHPNAQHL